MPGFGRSIGPVREKLRLMRRMLGIQYLRAAAALAVVVFHAFDRRGIALGPAAAGVDVFFVISGLVIWGSAAGRRIAPATFAWHRMVRIVPLYWTATLVLAVGAVAVPRLFPHLRPTADAVVLSLLFVPFQGGFGHVSLLIAGWTLTYEMFFYALFAAALLLPDRRRLPVLLIALAGLVVVGWVWRPAGPAVQTYTNPLLLEFAAGMVLAQVWRRGRVPGPAAGVLLLALGVALFGMVTISGLEVTNWRVVLWGIPATLVVAGTLAIEGGGWMPNWRLPARLGDASYSIYLLHPLLISALLHWAGATTAVFVTTCLILSCAVGLASFHWFERPVGRWLNRPRFGSRPPRPLSDAGLVRQSL